MKTNMTIKNPALKLAKERASRQFIHTKHIIDNPERKRSSIGSFQYSKHKV